MRIKLDENIAATVRLAALGHDVHTVIEEDLSGRVDSEVWVAAQLEERFLITQDLDFSDKRRFAAGSETPVRTNRAHSTCGGPAASPSRRCPARRHQRMGRSQE